MKTETITAQVTEAHRELARRIMFEFTQAGTAVASDVRMAAQLIADSEAKACDQLRAEVEEQCLLNGKGAEREADLRGRLERAEREVERLTRELAAANESLHLADGTANLALVHRDAAETELATERAKVRALREACERLRDCDWVITLPDRMDAVRDIARAAIAATEDKP